jgi:NADPH:quinone reductase-like Zn-dependent oxidoreductase/acyl carrier protein
VDFKVGDEVIASAGGSHGRHVIADSALVARKPSHLTFVEASTLPVAYLTAHFALSHLGRLRAGDRVLIHAAAGGVGLAACALARRAGAEIYATAGSEEKRQYLRDLGIRHFFDSRSPAFADAVMAATEGRGVTVVLNSLADEFVERSFSVLANGGRFLEIGKRGVWTPEQVRALGRDIEYHLIDWGETARQDPALMQRLFGEIVAAVQAGELHPLPATTFPLVQMRDAFRYMAQAKHIGKIVMQHPVLRPAGSVEFHTDATYLITGGLSGLGLETARWACERGARSLVLTSRTESDETRAVIDELRAGGADVRVWCADVGDAAQVQALVDRIRRELLPLRGVIHAAGALADRTLQSIAWDDFALVARAKIVGTVLLTEATRDCPLDFFVAYSSIAGVFGSPGQANHSAANAFMDAYVAGLWRGNRLGMSIAWGPWRDTGAAARENVLERNRQRGLEPLATRDGLQQLARAFARPAALLVGARITDPEALGGNRHRRFLERISRPRVASPSTSAAAPTSLGAQTFADQLAAQPAGVHRTFVVNRVKARVRAVLGLPTEFSLEAQRPLGELGLDSLLAIELRNVLGEDAGRRLPATLLFDHPTIDSLSDHLLSVLEPHTPSTDTRDVEPPGVPAPSSDPFASVESMSDEEVDRLLAAKLGSA